MDTYERRESPRYTLRLRLRYRVLDGVKTLWKGMGQSLDIGRTGIRFETAQRPLPPDAVVTLEVEWPVRLGGTVPLQLSLTGTVVRSDKAGVAVRLATWQFQVAQAPSKRIAERERARGWVPQGPPHVDKEQPGIHVA